MSWVTVIRVFITQVVLVLLIAMFAMLLDMKMARDTPLLPKNGMVMVVQDT
jgi:hypothetical protein